MRFVLTEDQRDFAASLDSLLAASDTVAAARAWADGDTAPGLALWARLAEQGVTALVVPEDAGGMGATPVELVVAFEAARPARRARPVGRVRGLPAGGLTSPSARGTRRGAVGTVAAPPHVPYALDADVAEHVFLAADGVLATATPASASPRSTAPVASSGSPPSAESDAHEAGDLDAAFDLAVLATSAQLLGCGERLLADSVTYVKQRKQFGREIGSYQAIKHAAGRRPDRPRLRPAAGLGRRARASIPARSRPPRWRAPTPPTSPRAPGSRCTARSATPRSST